MLTFRAPILIDAASDMASIRLTDKLESVLVDEVVDALVGQIGARVVAESEAGGRRTWELDYSGHSLILVYDRDALSIEPVYASAGCAIHDLQELFAIRARPDGY